MDKYPSIYICNWTYLFVNKGNYIRLEVISETVRIELTDVANVNVMTLGKRIYTRTPQAPSPLFQPQPKKKDQARAREKNTESRSRAKKR